MEESKIIYPHALKAGDRVCLIDPANAFTESGIEVTLQGLHAMGLQVDISPDMGFKRGTPAERADRLNAIIRNPEYKGIICVWGGYGTMTILNLLDYDALAENRPAFLGFSDVTAMHLAIQKRTGLVTCHGRSNRKDQPLSDANRDELWERLSNPEGVRELVNPDGSPLEMLHPGDAEGILTGGNLTLLSRLMGTPYEVDTKGKILFIEEVAEKPYRLHGMLQQLLMGGKLQQAEGILLGRFVSCDDAGRPGTGMTAVMDILNQVDVPVMGNLYAGHLMDPIPLPLGKVCRFEKGKVFL